MPHRSAATCIKLLESAAVPLLERARKLVLLEQAVLRLLPENLAGHCKVLNLKKETLVLSVNSSAWAARFRFAEPELVTQLQCHFPGLVRSVQVRIQSPSVKCSPKERSRLKISMENADILAQTARDINHPDLQEALYRLAAKAREI
jgi:hypothetical protein